MDTIKKFIKYALIIAVFYILVNIMAYGFILKTYKNINNYEVLVDKPSIEVVESKATKVNGYVVGHITNNTDALIYQKYLQINLYNSKDKYLGTTYVELSNFQVEKTLEFKANYKYNDVAKITIDITDDMPEQETIKLTPYEAGMAAVISFSVLLFAMWLII